MATIGPSSPKAPCRSTAIPTGVCMSPLSRRIGSNVPSVVEVKASDLPDCLGPSLVVTCISNDPAFRARFVSSPLVDRLNFGPLSTTQIGWDQPHEGNLFEHLYARRAIQRLA